MIGIIGRKLGMSQFFKEDGTRVPVTVIEAGPCPVMQVKNQKRDGYTAIQIGFGEKREVLINKPLKGHLKKAGAKSTRVLKEIRLTEDASYKEGQVIEVDVFQAGDFVDITGTSIGKGFQGGMKRWGWAGGKGGHGSMHHRRAGSIGASSYPSRVHKGKHMPGRMGGVTKTVQHLEVVSIDKEKHIMAVKGAVPGNENSFIMIKMSKKKEIAARKEAPKPAEKQEKRPENKDEKQKDQKA